MDCALQQRLESESQLTIQGCSALFCPVNVSPRTDLSRGGLKGRLARHHLRLSFLGGSIEASRAGV